MTPPTFETLKLEPREAVATWNAAMLMSEDLTEAMAAAQAKREPKFRD
jgi:hypothetical protein